MSYFVEEHRNYYRNTFGATFHKNMSIDEILNIWDTKVPQEVKDCFPELVTGFAALKIAYQLMQQAYHLYATSIMLYNEAKDLLDEATAILTGQFEFPATKAEKIVTALALNAEKQAIALAEQQLLPIILNAALAGRCRH